MRRWMFVSAVALAAVAASSAVPQDEIVWPVQSMSTHTNYLPQPVQFVPSFNLTTQVLLRCIPVPGFDGLFTIEQEEQGSTMVTGTTVTVPCGYRYAAAAVVTYRADKAKGQASCHTKDGDVDYYVGGYVLDPEQTTWSSTLTSLHWLVDP